MSKTGRGQSQTLELGFSEVKLGNNSVWRMCRRMENAALFIHFRTKNNENIREYQVDLWISQDYIERQNGFDMLK